MADYCSYFEFKMAYFVFEVRWEIVVLPSGGPLSPLLPQPLSGCILNLELLLWVKVW